MVRRCKGIWDRLGGHHLSKNIQNQTGRRYGIWKSGQTSFHETKASCINVKNNIQEIGEEIRQWERVEEKIATENFTRLNCENQQKIFKRYNFPKNNSQDDENLCRQKCAATPQHHDRVTRTGKIWVADHEFKASISPPQLCFFLLKLSIQKMRSFLEKSTEVVRASNETSLCFNTKPLCCS